MDKFWSKEFPITSVTRADLKAVGVPTKTVKTLTDEQMERIASKMADYYSDDSFWIHARIAVEYVLERNAGEQNGRS